MNLCIHEQSSLFTEYGTIHECLGSCILFNNGTISLLPPYRSCSQGGCAEQQWEPVFQSRKTIRDLFQVDFLVFVRNPRSIHAHCCSERPAALSVKHCPETYVCSQAQEKVFRAQRCMKGDKSPLCPVTTATALVATANISQPPRHHRNTKRPSNLNHSTQQMRHHVHRYPIILPQKRWPHPPLLHLRKTSPSTHVAGQRVPVSIAKQIHLNFHLLIPLHLHNKPPQRCRLRYPNPHPRTRHRSSSSPRPLKPNPLRKHAPRPRHHSAHPQPPRLIQHLDPARRLHRRPRHVYESGE